MPLLPDDKNNAVRPLKWYRNLATTKGRLEAGAFLVEGDRAIGQIINNNPDAVMEIISTEKLPSFYRKYPLRVVTESQLSSICASRTPQGTAAVVRMPLDIYSDRIPDNTGDNILLLEDVQDPRNVGSLIRTAVAFDYSGIILTQECADPLSPKSIQPSMGTVLSLWLRRTPRYLELVKELKDRGYSLVVTELNAVEGPSVLRSQDKLLLALGNEGTGLSRSLLDISDHRVGIPIEQEKIESLNVAACGAICMYLSYHKH